LTRFEDGVSSLVSRNDTGASLGDDSQGNGIILSGATTQLGCGHNGGGRHMTGSALVSDVRVSKPSSIAISAELHLSTHGMLTEVSLRYFLYARPSREREYS